VSVGQADVELLEEVEAAIIVRKHVTHLDIYLPEKHFLFREIVDWPTCPDQHEQSTLLDEMVGVESGCEAW